MFCAIIRSFLSYNLAPRFFLRAGSQTMGDDGRIWNWLNSVPTHPQEGHRDRSFHRPHKRAKLNNGRACHHKEEEDDDGHDDQGGSGDFALTQTDLTPGYPTLQRAACLLTKCQARR